MTLKTALSNIDASVEAYRALLRDNPEDYSEAAERQQEAADLLDRAQTEGSSLKGDDARTFSEAFSAANGQIEVMETKRIQGGDDEEDPDGEDIEEPSDDSENETAEMYSSLSHDDEDDPEMDAENSISE